MDNRKRSDPLRDKLKKSGVDIGAQVSLLFGKPSNAPQNKTHPPPIRMSSTTMKSTMLSFSSDVANELSRMLSISSDVVFSVRKPYLWQTSYLELDDKLIWSKPPKLDEIEKTAHLRVVLSRCGPEL